MKHIPFFAIGLLLALSTPAIGQTISLTTEETQMDADAVKVPNRVLANFNARYPDFSEVTAWQKNGQVYRATFRENEQEVVCDFNQDGRWLQSRTELAENGWPKAIRNYINDHYEEYEYLDGYRYDDDSGSRYELDLRSQNQDTRLSFDQDGGFVREGPVQ